MSERTDRLKGFKDGEETERAKIVKIIKKRVEILMKLTKIYKKQRLYSSFEWTGERVSELESLLDNIEGVR